MPFSVDLDSKKTVTVQEFNGVNLVNIREYYVDKKTGKKAPGRKGISLTEPLWKKLIAAAGDIDEALSELRVTNKEEAVQADDPEDNKEVPQVTETVSNEGNPVSS